MENIITAFLFGLFAGILPGPMLTSGFMTIIKNPKGLYKVFPFPIIAGLTEIAIAITMVHLGTLFFTNTTLFFITLLGIINIFWITFKIIKNRKNFSLVKKELSPKKTDLNYMAISYLEAFFLTLFNGPLYLFWITVCIPLAINTNESITNGANIFVIAMVLGVAIMTYFLFFLMHIARESFQNKRVIQKIPYIISGFFIFVGIKMILTAIEIFPF
jgi:threonine/homoserine/homoserine lactone efflux protein